MSVRKLFTEHPASVGETYLVHLAHASRFALHMLILGGACLIHSVLPFLFSNTASRAIAQLHERMVVNRRATGQAAAEQDDAPWGAK
jgi:hypothetical protein